MRKYAWDTPVSRDCGNKTAILSFGLNLNGLKRCKIDWNNERYLRMCESVCFDFCFFFVACTVHTHGKKGRRVWTVEGTILFFYDSHRAKERE